MSQYYLHCEQKKTLYLKPKIEVGGRKVRAEVGVPNKLMVNLGGKQSVIHEDAYHIHKEHFEKS